MFSKTVLLINYDEADGSFPTFPEGLTAAGVSWKIYQDLAGQTFAPDFGDGTGNSFAGNFTDNSMLYFNLYANSSPGSPLFDNGCTGTQISNIIPSTGARLALRFHFQCSLLESP